MPQHRLGQRHACRARCRRGSTLHERFGKLPFADLFEPAIQYAQRRLSRLLHGGAPVGRAPSPAEAASRAWSRPSCRTAARRSPASSGSSPTRRGRLRRIAESKGEAFYRGELAEAMDSYAQETGGALRRADLAAHKRRLGRSDRPHLSRHDAARDPAQRARASPPAWRSASSRTSTSPGMTATGPRSRICRSRR